MKSVTTEKAEKIAEKFCVIFYWTVTAIGALFTYAMVFGVIYGLFYEINFSLGLPTNFLSVLKTMGITVLSVIGFVILYVVGAFLYSAGEAISEKNERKVKNENIRKY